MALLVQHVGAKPQARPAVHGIVHLGGLSVSFLCVGKPCVRHAVPLWYHWRQLRQIAITLQCFILLLCCVADSCRVGHGRYADHLFVRSMLEDIVNCIFLLLCHSVLLSQHLSSSLLGSNWFACAISATLHHAVAFCGGLVGNGRFVRGEAPGELKSRVLLHSARDVVLGGIVLAFRSTAGSRRSFGALRGLVGAEP